MTRFLRILKSKTLIGTAVAVLLYTLGGFFLAPYLLKTELTKIVREDLRRNLRVDRIRLNPYSLRLEIEGLGLTETDGTPLLGFGRLLIDFDASSIWEGAWVFSDIRLDRPEVRFAIDAGGETNLGRFLDDLPSEPDTAPPSPGDPPRLLIRQLLIGSGSLHLVDTSSPTPTNATIGPLDLELHDLTTIPDREGPHQLVAGLPGGGNLSWQGEASLSPVHSHGRILVEGLKPAEAWRFFRKALLIEEPGGSLRLETGYRFTMGSNGPQLEMKGLNVDLSGLSLKPEGSSEPLVALSTVSLQEGSFNLAERRLGFTALTLADGKVSALIDRKGVATWERLVAPTASRQAATPAAAQPPAPPGPPWHLDLDKVAVKNVALHGADLSRKTPVDISLGGLGLSMRLVGEFAPEKVQTAVDDFAASLGDIRLTERESRATLGSLAGIELNGGTFDLEKRRISLKKVSLRGGDLAVERDRSGQINWVQQALDPGVVRDDARKARVRAESEGRPWSLAVSQVEVNDTSVSIVDQAIQPSELLGLTGIDLTLTDVSLDPQQPIGFHAALEVRQGGAVRAKGTIHPSQPSVDGDIEVERLGLTTAQPFIDKLAHMKLTSGTLSGGGKLLYGAAQPGALEFTGDLAIAGLEVLEPHTGKTLVGWEEVNTRGMRFGLAPNALSVDEIDLERPEGTLVIDENKATNWQYALKDQAGGPQSETSADPAASSDEGQQGEPVEQSGFPVSIARIRVEDGALNFADLSLTPQFATHIHELHGSIAGLSTVPGSKSAIELEGRVDEYGEAKIRGELEPSSPTHSTDIHMSFRNVEMTHLTPYSIRFAGHEVTSGKLSLDLGYKIDKEQLEGENQVILQHLELGKKVESPDALDLPLELGLALLKDPSGKIDIDLPIQGDMSHPEFNFGQIIGKAVANLFGKLVTAPFAVLGSILGTEAEGLDQIAFEPGRSDLPPPEREKLAMVAKAMRERPQLGISIQATYDSQLDRSALGDRKVRLAVAKALGGGASSEGEPGPISYDDPKTRQALEQLAAGNAPKALERLRQAASGTGTAAEAKKGKPVPQAAAGVRELYEAIYAELVENTVVTHNELRSLGTERAQSVRRELTGTDGIPAERLHIAKPAKAESTPTKAGEVITRLELSAAK